MGRSRRRIASAEATCGYLARSAHVPAGLEPQWSSGARRDYRRRTRRTAEIEQAPTGPADAMAQHRVWVDLRGRTPCRTIRGSAGPVVREGAETARQMTDTRVRHMSKLLAATLPHPRWPADRRGRALAPPRTRLAVRDSGGHRRDRGEAMAYKTIIEPFRVHTVQAIDLPDARRARGRPRARRLQPLRPARRRGHHRPADRLGHRRDVQPSSGRA